MSLNDEDFSSDSDDVDYVPTAEDVSEEENSGEEEDLSLLQDGESSKVKGKRKGGKKGKAALQPRKRTGGIKLDEDDGGVVEAEDKDNNKEFIEQIKREEEAKKAEKEKKKADDIWSSFMAGVKPLPKPQAARSTGLGALCSSTSKSPMPARLSPGSVDASKTSAACSAAEKVTGKVTIMQVFDFAGEEVRVTKEVAADSKEGKAELNRQKADEETVVTSSASTSSQSSSKPSTESSPSVSPSPSIPGLNIAPASSFFPSLLGRTAATPSLKRPESGRGGLSAVLSRIGKKPKMSTLEKSKMDWESFKKDEGIDEDLKIFNRGKGGYMERKAFLDRTDQRQFEIEKGLRQKTRKSDR